MTIKRYSNWISNSPHHHKWCKKICVRSFQLNYKSIFTIKSNAKTVSSKVL